MPMYRFRDAAFAVAASAMLVASAAAETSNIGDWITESDVSQLDDTKQYFAGLSSTNTVINLIGAPDHARLHIRCTNNTLDIFVIWPLFMGSGDVDVKWKFDDGPIYSQAWAGSSDGTGSFAPSPHDFLTQLGNSKRLVIDGQPYQRESAEAVFDLGNVSAVEAATIAMCPS
jgi:hypothetical protein